MLPIILDGARIRVAAAGQGESLQRRVAMLAKAGIGSPRIVSEMTAAGLSGIAVLFVAGFDEALSARWAEAARSAGVLVNVEDMPAFCDFHVPAQLHRGDLLITISTSGRSPGLARILREHLESLFGPEWGGILDATASARDKWRVEGLPPEEVSRRTRAMMQGQPK